MCWKRISWQPFKGEKMEGIANYDHISNIVEVRDLMNMELNRAAMSFVRIG